MLAALLQFRAPAELARPADSGGDLGLAEEELEPAGAMGAVCRAGEGVKRSSYERPYNPVLEQSCV